VTQAKVSPTKRDPVLAPEHIPQPNLRVPDNVLIRMPGVGGTGVVTVSVIIQMASYLEGVYSAGLDQIGLAQKGGPVVSDVRISRAPIVGQLRASLASVDVILGFDAIGATSPDSLAVADVGRTIAVLNTSVIATAPMVTNVNTPVVSVGRLSAELDKGSRRDENVAIDAGVIAESLFGDHFATNMILLGAAFQHGCIPLRASSVERAIALNGASVDANIQAFRWGRIAIANPELLAAALDGSPAPIPTNPEMLEIVRNAGVSGNLVEAVARRFDELKKYQNARLAEIFLKDVLDVQVLEVSIVGKDTLVVTSAYIEGLFKLMAYKDEYEVARLHLDERSRIREHYGKDAKIRVLLQPPILKAMGLNRKIRCGPGLYLAFRVLRAMRVIRGSRLDPFGYAKMRSVERQLVDDYKSAIGKSLEEMTNANVRVVEKIAKLPDAVRGYDEVKLKNVEIFRQRLGELLSQMSTPETLESFN
jgi:indolepyruvate ferredoxin oxidoreductase